MREHNFVHVCIISEQCSLMNDLSVNFTTQATKRNALLLASGQCDMDHVFLTAIVLLIIYSGAISRVVH